MKAKNFINKLIKGFSVVSMIFTIGFVFNNCGSGFETVKDLEFSSLTGQTERTLENTPIQEVPAESAPEPTPANISLSPVTGIVSNLGVMNERMIEIRSADNYSGKVTFTIDRPELDLIDLADDIVITTEPAEIIMVPGEAQMVKIIVQVKESSHSFTDQHFHVMANYGPNQASLKMVDVNFQVNAVWEVDMMGGAAPEVWSSPTTPVQIRKHVGGTKIRFNNMDLNGNHIVHGTGAIPHGDRNNPLLAPAAAGLVGGVYEVDINENDPAAGASYYCHTDEASGMRRQITVNFDAVAAATAIRVPASTEH